MDGVGDVDVELGVIGEHQRHVQPLAQHPGQHHGGDGTVAVDQVDMAALHLLHQLRRQGEARPVAHQLRHVDAGIAQHREGIGAVVGVGIVGRYHRGVAVVFLDNGGVVGDRVGHAVDHRREGIVDETDTAFFGHKSGSFPLSFQMGLLYRILPGGATGKVWRFFIVFPGENWYNERKSHRKEAAVWRI